MSVCPHCSVPVPAGAQFCPGCGRPLDASSSPTRLEAAPSPPATRTSSAIDGGFAPGTLLAGRYRIVGLLGRGGMGEVYRAEDLTLAQPVALKFLPAKLAAGSSALDRFHQEVRIARQVSHPNVCRIYDIGEADGRRFLSMEYVDGEDLRSLLRRAGRLSGERAVAIARQICAGLAAAHDRGVLHRDLKPANVMIDGQGRARITDFGLAALAGEVGQDDVRSGTPFYMAPEQLAGRSVSIASDVYSLGLVLFELFTGKSAWQADTIAELTRLHEEGPSRPSSFAADIDPAVERVILRCLSFHPAERPATALAVAAALPGGDPLAEALAAGETPSPGMVAAAGALGALRPAAAWGALAAVAAGAAILVALLGPTRIMGHVPLPKEPAVLVAEAKAILRDAGQSSAPADEAWGFRSNERYLEHPRGGGATRTPGAPRVRAAKRSAVLVQAEPVAPRPGGRCFAPDVFRRPAEFPARHVDCLARHRGAAGDARNGAARAGAGDTPAGRVGASLGRTSRGGGAGEGRPRRCPIAMEPSVSLRPAGCVGSPCTGRAAPHHTRGGRVVSRPARVVSRHRTVGEGGRRRR